MVPGAEQEILLGEHEGGGEMQGIDAAKLASDRELYSIFGKALVHFDHAERGPLLTRGSRCCLACAQADSADGLDEAHTTHEPALGTVHDVADQP